MNRPDTRRARALVSVLLAFSLAAACAQKTQPQLSPKGQADYNATQAIKAVDILRDAAVGAEAQTPKLLTTETTRKVVAFHRLAVSAMAAEPSGWKAVVAAALAQLQKDVSAEDWHRLEPYAALVRTLVTASPEPDLDLLSSRGAAMAY